MKSYRRIMTLLLCLLVVCTASSASAATKKLSKTFTAVPTIKFTDAPKHGTASGEMNDLTISASLPGFLNLYLVDESGRILLTIAKNFEIPSSTTTFDFYAIDDDGDLIDAGNYMFSADMVTQFGVASKTVTRNTVIKEADPKTLAARAAANKSSTADSTKIGTADSTKIGTPDSTKIGTPDKKKESSSASSQTSSSKAASSVRGKVIGCKDSKSAVGKAVWIL